MHFNKRPFVKPAACINNDTGFDDPATNCGKPSFRLFHGFLCLDHFRKQAQSLPVRPRKPLYLRRPPVTDDMIITDIIATDKAIIAAAREAGKVQTVRYGRYEPAEIEFLQV